MKVLGVVTARGGSKGLPGKNLKPLAGKPLLAWTIDEARASGAFDRLVMSTDDEAIAAEARVRGCEVPFLRPAALAQDDTPHLPVIQHAVRWLDEHEGYRPDAVMILQPTSPLRSAEDIRAAIARLEASGADSVVSVSEVGAHAHPMRMLQVDDAGAATLFVSGAPVRDRINRRQDLPPAWVMNGAIYACRTAVLTADPPSLYGDRVVAYPMPAVRGLSIDDLHDWEHVERALARLSLDSSGHPSGQDHHGR
ncbi:MAG: acylneuraminate cytidylyltransferase family protein [Vicinamibacterales bacterium]|nr:acylneuraminate cytidylyltransferase family protein [Vicinamibacterales bacterium]